MGQHVAEDYGETGAPADCWHTRRPHATEAQESITVGCSPINVKGGQAQREFMMYLNAHGQPTEWVVVDVEFSDRLTRYLAMDKQCNYEMIGLWVSAALNAGARKVTMAHTTPQMP